MSNTVFSTSYCLTLPIMLAGLVSAFDTEEFGSAPKLGLKNAAVPLPITSKPSIYF